MLQVGVAIEVIASPSFSNTKLPNTFDTSCQSHELSLDFWMQDHEISCS